MGLYLHPGGAPRSQSQYFSNGNFSMKKFTNPKTNTISIWKTFKVWGYGTADHQKSIVLKFLKSPQKGMKQFVEREQWILKIQNESLRVKSGLTFHFHTPTLSNERLKFHFRVNFSKTSFSPLGSEGRAKIFTVLITWLGLVNFANLCHSGTLKGFWAVRVPWSEPDHHKAVCDMTLTILWKSHQKNSKKYTLKIFLL